MSYLQDHAARAGISGRAHRSSMHTAHCTSVGCETSQLTCGPSAATSRSASQVLSGAAHAERTWRNSAWHSSSVPCMAIPCMDATNPHGTCANAGRHF